MAIIEATAGNAPVIEDGVYPVIVREVIQTVMENDQFGHKNKLRFTLEFEGMTNDEGEPLTLDPLINEKLSLPDAKMVSTLTLWAKALGVSPEHGRIDTDDFIGKRGQAVVKTAKEGDWPKVTDMMPAKKGAVAAPAVTTDTSPEVDTFAFLKVAPNGDPEVNWPMFWSIAKPYGINSAGVSAEAGGTKIEEIDPFDLPGILERLIAKVNQ